MRQYWLAQPRVEFPKFYSRMVSKKSLGKRPTRLHSNLFVSLDLTTCSWIVPRELPGSLLGGFPNEARLLILFLVWYRILEVIGALTSVLLIWVVTGILIYMAIQRIVNEEYEIDAEIMLITSGVGLIVNIM